MLEKYGKKLGFDSKIKIAALLGQVGAETGGLKTLNSTENLNYTHAKRLVFVYPDEFSGPNKHDPSKYLNNPRKLANLVYANRLGNGPPSSGDGWRYRGRGILQLTFHDNYEAFQTFYNNNHKEFGSSSTKDFLGNPTLIKSNDNLAILSGMWYFKKRVFDRGIKINDTDKSIKAVTEAIHGRTKGTWKDRKEYFEKAESDINCKS